MNVRLYRALLLDEELKKEKSIVAYEEIKLQQGDKLTLVFDEKIEREILAMDESSPKALIQMDSTLFPSFQELARFMFNFKKEVEPSMGYEEAKQENDTLLDLEEKNVQSNPNLEVMLPIFS